ncbi:MAG: flavin reductase [Bacteroidaceae bacterium]|nr:flavin reductase [Bacteroidaceae bacterium]MBP5322786.1 flavin reductase [Bacteroidaceae bacterium]
MKKNNLSKWAVACLFLLLPFYMSAQEDMGFQSFRVTEDFDDNGFCWFRDAQLLAAGDSKASNAMTIGWGGIGTLWGKSALTVYVAEKRYTKKFMDSAEYFTVMSFDAETGKKVLNYMGRKSGRDEDKAKALGLHVAYTPNGTPYYVEATVVIECQTMYSAPFDPKGFRSDVPKKMYSNFPAGIHTMYIGEVVNAWKR